MLSKLGALALLAPFAFGLTINTPESLTSGGSAIISWTSVAGDPSAFSVALVNQDSHNSFALANNVQTSLGSITVSLPVVPPGGDYILEAVDITDVTQVFATSADFSIFPAASSS